MSKGQRKKMSAEWKEIMKKHPTFARAFLAQQAIMMEASELGYRLIDKHTGIRCQVYTIDGVAILVRSLVLLSYGEWGSNIYL